MSLDSDKLCIEHQKKYFFNLLIIESYDNNKLLTFADKVG